MCLNLKLKDYEDCKILLKEKENEIEELNENIKLREIRESELSAEMKLRIEEIEEEKGNEIANVRSKVKLN